MFDGRSALNKGLRQGCNLSLVLFTLHVVVLANSIRLELPLTRHSNDFVSYTTTSFKQRGLTKDTGSNTNNLFSINNIPFNFSHNLCCFKNNCQSTTGLQPKGAHKRLSPSLTVSTCMFFIAKMEEVCRNLQISII